MKTTQHAIHTFDDLGDVLSSEITKLINGKTTVAQAKTVSALAGRMISGIRVLLEYIKVTGKHPESNFLNLFNKLQDETPHQTNAAGNGKRKHAEQFAN